MPSFSSDFSLQFFSHLNLLTAISHNGDMIYCRGSANDEIWESVISAKFSLAAESEGVPTETTLLDTLAHGTSGLN